MNIAITFRHMDASEAVKGYSNEKVGRMQRFLRAPLKAQVTLSCCHHEHLHHVEVDIHSGHEHFHAHDTNEDIYAALDKVVDKIERQIVSAKKAAFSKKKGADRAWQHLPTLVVAEE